MSSLLTDIKSPQLNADYAKNLSGVFDNIHNNFEQIVSIPYLAGVAGASFEPIEKSIWNNKSSEWNDWTLNEWGVRIVNAIFFDNDEKQQFKEEDVPSGIKAADIESHIEASVNATKYQRVKGTSYTYAYENLFVNDILYLYATRDDSNEITNYYLGQYYHFTDARLANRKGINNVNWAFEDASCFLYYTPDKDNPLKGTFHKIYSLPVVYYDTTNEDWCWMFDNNKTGISCKGIQGDKGVDGVKFHMVRVDHTHSSQEQHTHTQSAPDSLYYNNVISYAAMASDTSLGNQEWKNVDDNFIKEVRNGDAAFAIISTRYNAETKKLDEHYKDIDITMCTLYKGIDNEDGKEKIVVKASYDRINMFQQWDNHLKDGLQQIGKIGEDLEHWNRGLFVPAISFGKEAPEAYMIWADSVANTVHIGLVKDANVTQGADPVQENDAIIALDNNTIINGNVSANQINSKDLVTNQIQSQQISAGKIGASFINSYEITTNNIIATEKIKGPVISSSNDGSKVEMYDNRVAITTPSFLVLSPSMSFNADNIFFNQNIRIQKGTQSSTLYLDDNTEINIGDKIFLRGKTGPPISKALTDYTENTTQTESFWGSIENRISGTVTTGTGSVGLIGGDYKFDNLGKTKRSGCPYVYTSKDFVPLGRTIGSQDAFLWAGCCIPLDANKKNLVDGVTVKFDSKSIDDVVNKLLDQLDQNKQYSKVEIKINTFNIPNYWYCYLTSKIYGDQYLYKYGRQSPNNTNKNSNQFSTVLTYTDANNNDVAYDGIQSIGIASDGAEMTAYKYSSTQEKRYRNMYILSNADEKGGWKGFGKQIGNNRTLHVKWRVPLTSELKLPEFTIYKQEGNAGPTYTYKSPNLTGGVYLKKNYKLYNMIYCFDEKTSEFDIKHSGTTMEVKGNEGNIAVPVTMTATVLTTQSKEEPKVEIYKDKILLYGSFGSVSKVCMLTPAGIRIQDSNNGGTYLEL